uniref:Uncharacterized protein n=1 Tax=Magallana gigas TaxID=29159 RepID=A0A8W8IFH0_MAGGI
MFVFASFEFANDKRFRRKLQGMKRDRDWNQSHVYRMINETRTNERQVYPSGQGNQPITTKTVQTTQKTYSYDYQPTMEDGYGVSEF